MFLSVVIPCYNASAYITRCLDALSAQSFQDFDVIIVDDKSTDNSLCVINDYKAKSHLNIKVVANNENRGPAYSRLQGIKCSDSDFICFCDSDDWYDTAFLQEMVKEQVNSHADVVLCSFRLVFSSGRDSERLVVYQKEELGDKHLMLVKGSDSLCLMLIRRQVLLDIPHPNLRNGEDMALIPLVFTHCRIISSVNKCLYNYYCRERSASMKPSKAMVDSLVDSFLFINMHLSSDYINEKEFIGIRNLLYGALINLFKFSNDHKIANQILSDFESDYPCWENNHYMHLLPLYKRLLLHCVKRRNWFLVKLISLAHNIYFSLS